ncbi:MAG: ubiquitin-like protein Pup [Actinomycetota bacterium]|nr:ubiquitin-like protein Pup [Actinomycetota bacterium]
MPTRESGGGQSKATRKSDEAAAAETAGTPESDVKERHEKLTDDVDDMLDEIDSVLEENSEEFVRSFVQKGGQ